MSAQSADLETVRQTYNDRLNILRQSRILYNKNKHRSVPNRGPYEYGLKVAQEEFNAAKEALETMLQSARQSDQLAESANSAQPSDKPIENKNADKQNAKRRPQRVFLAKLQQAEAIKKELALH